MFNIVSLFANVVVPAAVVDGVAIPAFKANSAVVYAVSHISGSQWETNILAPMIAAVRAQGAAAEAEATGAAVGAINAALGKLGNPLIVMLVESLVDGEIETLVSNLFGVVLAAVGDAQSAAAPASGAAAA